MGCLRCQHRVHHGDQHLHARHRILHRGALFLASLQKHQELPCRLKQIDRSRVSSRKRKKIAAISSFLPRHQQHHHKCPPTQMSGHARSVRCTTHLTSCSAVSVVLSNLLSRFHNTSVLVPHIQRPVCQHHRHSRDSEGQARRLSNQQKEGWVGIVCNVERSWRTSGGRALSAAP